MLSAADRLTDGASFQTAVRSGRRAGSRTLVVHLAVPAGPARPARVGFVVSRAVGNAVVRNRLRRRFRALFAELAPELRPGTYLVGAAPAAAPLDYGDLRRTLWTALAELAERS